MKLNIKGIINYKKLLFLIILCCCCLLNNLKAQTYVFGQLQGSPVNTTGWNLQGSAVVTNVKNTGNSEIMLCPNQRFVSGAVFYNKPINLAICNKWAAEFDFRIFDGSKADGIAFCFLDVPPVGFVNGGGLGIPATANGLKVCFDPNPNCAPYSSVGLPKIEMRWGKGYDECWAQPTVSNVNGSLDFIRSDNYNHVKITYDTGNISVYVNNQLYLTGYQQFNFAGYMGFTASTGNQSDNHSIKNVTIYTDMPPSDAGAGQTICSGSSVQVGSATNSTYSYNWYPAAGLSATNVANPTVMLTNTTASPLVKKYYVQTSFKNGTGCTSVDSVLVTVMPIPSVTIKASANNVCAGTPVTLTASPLNVDQNAIYKWYNNGVAVTETSATYASSTFKNNDKITCTVTSASCSSAVSNRVTLSVIDNVAPAITIATPSTSVCQGTNVVFTATASATGTAPVYQWKINGVNSGTNSATFSSATLKDQDVVSCQLTSNAACAVPASVTSNTITMSVPTIVAPQATITATSTDVCQGTPVTFSVTVTNGTTSTYQWMINGADAGSNSTLSGSNFKDKDVITCNLVVNGSCTTAANISAPPVVLKVSPMVNPAVTITSSSASVCSGTPVIYTAQATNAGASPVYQWMVNNIATGSNSDTFTSYKPINNDRVTCIVTPQNVNCLVKATATSNTLTTTVSDSPTAQLPSSLNVYTGNTVTLQPVITGDIVTYSWSPTTGLSDPTVKNPIASPTDNITYTLTVTTAAGCPATASTNIIIQGREIEVPNTFSPNNDGHNDTWQIKYINSYPKSTVNVFNRYGSGVFSSIGYSSPWDGRYNGSYLPVGVYYYVIDLKNGKPAVAGYLTIIR